MGNAKMGVGKETAERVLGESSVALNAAVKDDNSRQGVTIRFKCACMKQRAKAAIWLGDKGAAVTMEHCGRIVAEEILEAHSKCLGIVPPSQKRNWLQEAAREAEQQSVKKKKAEEKAAEEAAGEAAAKTEELRKDLEENDARVTRGASIEPIKENTSTFDDPSLTTSVPFYKKKQWQQISPFDSTSTAQDARSTPRSRLSRALNHARNGLTQYVRYWAVGSFVRVALLLVALAKAFSVGQDVIDGITTELHLDGEVSAEAHIVDAVRGFLHITKRCESEEMRSAHYHVMTAVAVEEGYREAVTRRLGISKKNRPWRYCLQQREQIREWQKDLASPLKVGDRVASK